MADETPSEEEVGLRPLPQQLIGASSEVTHETREQQVEAVTPSPMDSSSEHRLAAASSEGFAESLWNCHAYLNEYIRFADAKAGVVLTFTSALFAGLSATGLHQAILSDQAALLLVAVILLAFGSLVSSIVAAVLAVLPRTKKTQERNVLSWPDIAAFATVAAYEEAWTAAASSCQITPQLIRHLYLLGQVCERKYRWVHRSILLTAIGATAGMAALLLRELASP